MLTSVGWLFVVLGFYGDEPSQIHETKTDGSFEMGWSVQVPTGSSDYLNVRYDAVVDTTLSGISISVADFGTSFTFPIAGIFPSNFTLDPTGVTPDLALPLDSILAPPLGGGALFDVCDYLLTAPVDVLAGDVYHVVAQLPPGDPGLLMIGADTDSIALGGGEPPGLPNPIDASFFSSDAYLTPAQPSLLGEMGLGVLEDSCAHVLTSPGETILRCVTSCSDLTGDFDTVSVQAGSSFGFFAVGEALPGMNTLGLIMFSLNGIPLRPFGGPAPFIRASDDCTAYFRACGTWPCGIGVFTVNFVEITGIAGVPGSIRVSNEVTVHSLADPAPDFVAHDDGTFESSWTIQNPTGNSDFFSVSFPNANVGSDAFCGVSISAMDFGTTVGSYPLVGSAPPALVLDPSGLTPDLSNPYTSSPLPFPALTFVTTADQMVSQVFVPITPVGDVIAFAQMPPGDVGFLSLGADSDGVSSGASGFTIDGFTTPALTFPINWGIRLR